MIAIAVLAVSRAGSCSAFRMLALSSESMLLLIGAAEVIALILPA
jgi:hypothetical protein